MSTYLIYRHKCIKKCFLIIIIMILLCGCSTKALNYTGRNKDGEINTLTISKTESKTLRQLLDNCEKSIHPYMSGPAYGDAFFTFEGDEFKFSGDWIDCIINIDGTWYLCDPMDPMFDYIRDLSVKYGNTWYLSKDIIQVLSELNPFPTVWGAYKNFLQLKVSDKTELNYMMSYFNKDNSDNKLLGEVIKDVKMNEEYVLEGIRIKVISCSGDTFIAIAELSE